MESVKLPTCFLPAQRAGFEVVACQNDAASRIPLLQETIDRIPHPVLLLNRDRQIILCNKAFLSVAGEENTATLLGTRPGEALDCVNSRKTAGGCGTTENCAVCGVGQSLFAAMRGKKAKRECRLTRRGDPPHMDLRIWTSVFKHGGGVFTLFFATDISDEKRKEAFERIFFHDVLNTASGLEGISHLLKNARPEDQKRFGEILNRLSRQIIDEIQAQRELTLAEQGVLKPVAGAVNIREFLDAVASSMGVHKLAHRMKISVARCSVDGELQTDRTLLWRVLVNMVKNALEASAPGDIVTIGARECEDAEAVEFWVHNPGVMPKNVQLQIFQRSFSTKEPGRGLGTYSIKLLAERYLQGRAGFTSGEGEGTVFFARIPYSLPHFGPQR